MIDIKSLSKFYGSRKVLNNINFKIRRGAVTGIVGANACGKTTLMKCLLGLVIQTEGEISIDGEKSDALGTFRKKIGYMPQASIFPQNLTILELLNMLERLRGESANSKDELLEYFELKKILDQSLEQLSGGTQQKVAAVIAFMFNAPLIILDEPTVGLDPVTAVRFKDLVLARSKQGATIILVSHIMSEIEQMANEVVFIDEGNIIFSGTTAELLKKTNSQQLERSVIRLFEDRKNK
jgi:Cu-processing system ATP-binding protein